MATILDSQSLPRYNLQNNSTPNSFSDEYSKDSIRLKRSNQNLNRNAKRQFQQKIIKKIAITLKLSPSKNCNESGILLNNHTTTVLEKLLNVKLDKFLYRSYDDEPSIPVLSKILNNDYSNICFIQKILHSNQKDYSIITLTFMDKDNIHKSENIINDFSRYDIQYSLIFSTLDTPPHSCTLNKLQKSNINLFEGNMFHLPCLLNFCDRFNTTDNNTYSVRKDIMPHHPIYGNSSFLDTKNDGHIQHFRIISMEVRKIKPNLDGT